MECVFDWSACQSLSNLQKDIIERKIRQDLNLHQDELKPCHPGPVLIPLNIVDTSPSNLIGVIWCNCKKPYAWITGNSDGSLITYESLN